MLLVQVPNSTNTPPSGINPTTTIPVAPVAAVKPSAREKALHNLLGKEAREAMKLKKELAAADKAAKKAAKEAAIDAAAKEEL
ncbi:MAG: hypothetical protein ACT6RN_27605 [Agrobacterium sp.]|uniref:hypothetical protein n=1 Tax=Agrobacterium sp. TaxID=361 RepID=UPI004037C08C